MKVVDIIGGIYNTDVYCVKLERVQVNGTCRFKKTCYDILICLVRTTLKNRLKSAVKPKFVVCDNSFCARCSIQSQIIIYLTFKKKKNLTYQLFLMI